MVTVDDVRLALFRDLDFSPTTAQQPILMSSYRFTLVTGGQQAGKSVVAAKYLETRSLEIQDRPALYWLVGADYERTSAEFEYLRGDFTKLGWLTYASKRVDPGLIILDDDTRIETKSAKDPRRIAQKAPDGIVLCEAGTHELETFHRVRDRVGPMRGWVLLIGTLESSFGWFPALAQQWRGGYDGRKSYVLPSWSNTFLYPGGRFDPEILSMEADSSPEWFNERQAGMASPPQGLVFKEFNPEIHIKPIKWEPDFPVHLWEDPGFGTQSAHALMAAQIINGQVRIFEEFYHRGLITQEIIEMVNKRPWWKGVKFLVSDPNYKDQHHSMTSVAEQWMKETGLYASGDRFKINIGTERLKAFLKPDPVTHEAKIIFDPSCHGILSEFGYEGCPLDGPDKGRVAAYQWKLDRLGSVIGDSPEDKNNHSIKATIYGLIDNFGYGMTIGSDTIRVKRWK